MTGMFARTTVGVGLIGLRCADVGRSAGKAADGARGGSGDPGTHWRAVDEQDGGYVQSGNPDAPVTGIAVTMMATLDVLQRAASNGQNLIITHEPTFFNHYDEKPEGMDETTWCGKRNARSSTTQTDIWRLHDHWHRRMPDGIQAG